MRAMRQGQIQRALTVVLHVLNITTGNNSLSSEAKLIYPAIALPITILAYKASSIGHGNTIAPMVSTCNCSLVGQYVSLLNASVL